MIRRRMLKVTGGAAIYPLLVLFGLNAVDELDRTAFAVLLPNIRDEFGLDLTGVLSLIAVVAFGALLLQVPIANLADRYNRVRITWIGALCWGVFSLMTGLATTLVFLAIARSGSGIGVLLVLLILPGGLGGLLYRLRDRWLAHVATRHHIDAPGFVPDTSAAVIHAAEEMAEEDEPVGVSP